MRYSLRNLEREKLNRTVKRNGKKDFINKLEGTRLPQQKEAEAKQEMQTSSDNREETCEKRQKKLYQIALTGSSSSTICNLKKELYQ